jgi:DNA-binding CsgD family transcriptional regulator
MNISRELADRDAALLALVAAVAAYAVAHEWGDWRVAITAGVGVVALRIGAGILLHGTHRLPDDPLPGLTEKESDVARYVHRGLGDPAIARRLGISLKRVDGRVNRIQAKWRVSTRKEIAEHVAQVLGEPPEHPVPGKQRWEWIAELGTGIAIMALGLGSLTLSVDTPLVGSSKDWLGLSLLIGGLVFCALSTVTYFWERTQTNHAT